MSHIAASLPFKSSCNQWILLHVTMTSNQEMFSNLSCLTPGHLGLALWHSVTNDLTFNGFTDFANMLKGSNSRLSSLSNNHLIARNSEKKSHRFFPGDVLKWCFVPLEVKNVQMLNLQCHVTKKGRNPTHLRSRSLELIRFND